MSPSAVFGFECVKLAVRSEGDPLAIWKPGHPATFSETLALGEDRNAPTRILLIPLPANKCGPDIPLLAANVPLCLGASLASVNPDSSSSGWDVHSSYPDPGRRSGKAGRQLGGGLGASQHCPYLEKPLGREQAAASCSS